MSLLLLLDDGPSFPRSLFASGEQGIWLDPSDFSTLFQDSAGTTPVTAVGQPVGKILDKSGRGNHASQTTSASRPTVEARVNLFTKSEQFDDPDWFGGGAGTFTVTANQATAPDGTVTADKFIGATIASQHRQNRAVINTTMTLSVWMRTNAGTRSMRLFINDTIGSATTVTVTTSWQRFSFTSTVGAALIGSGRSGLDNQQVLDETNHVYVWGADLRLASDAAYPYQRVNTATDYVDVGAPRYLSFDGTDDGMATPSINFTNTDKMTVWAGVRKLSDAALGIICELTTDAATLNGFYVAGPGGTAAASYRIAVGTPSAQILSSATFAAPVSNVLAVSYDKAQSTAATVMALRTNGTLNAYGLGVEGNPSGNFANAALFIGRRNNASLPFNGRIYQLIVRGAASNAGQIAAGEAWCNSKTRAYA